MIRSKLGKVKRYISNTVDPGAMVLLYHRVIGLEQDPQLLSVRPDHFYQQVKFLKEAFELLSIEDFYGSLCQKKRFPDRAVILSFDDGYADNFSAALPILESLNAQALFYISTAGLGTANEMWWDELERVFLSGAPLPEQLELRIRSRDYHFRTCSEEERRRVYGQLHPLLKYSVVEERDRVLSVLRQWAGQKADGRPDHLMMTPDEVRRMGLSASAVIGAHTHNHPALSVLGYEDQLSEMRKSKKILEEIVQKEVLHFSYPFGSKKDYNANSIEAAKAAGFKMVCANHYGQVHRWTKPYAIPRILVRDWGVEEFRQKLKTFARF
jgi:peptidoglycan/xylan/chitin deacetylase (PgdA/CDA1 family)